jgi:hypothetical protein
MGRTQRRSRPRTGRARLQGRDQVVHLALAVAGVPHIGGYGAARPGSGRHTRADPPGWPPGRHASLRRGHRPAADSSGLPRGRHASERHRGLSGRSAWAFLGLVAYIAGLALLAVLSYKLWA